MAVAISRAPAERSVTVLPIWARRSAQLADLVDHFRLQAVDGRG